jgi:hypothetical protein
MIKIVPREDWAPLLQNALEPPGLHVSCHHIIVHVGEPVARQGGLAKQVGVVKDERALDANLEGPPTATPS